MGRLPRGDRGRSGPADLILDTDAFSRVTGRPAERGPGPTRLGGLRVGLTFPTVSELQYGAHKARWGQPRRALLQERIDGCVVLGADEDLARVCGWLRARARGMGHPLHHPVHANDLWIAACAVYYDLPLLTANRRHFAGLPGLRLAD